VSLMGWKSALGIKKWTSSGKASAAAKAEAEDAGPATRGAAGPAGPSEVAQLEAKLAKQQRILDGAVQRTREQADQLEQAMSELATLKAREKASAAELAKLGAGRDHARESQQEMQERWNMLSFKHQVLVDMWTMRVLDNDDGEDAEEGDEQVVEA